MTIQQLQPFAVRQRVARSTVAVAVMLALSFQAQAVDISNTPLATVGSVTVRANMMFIMDDSLSMRHDYVPDDADYNNHCFADANINKLFYNPAVTYVPPPQANGGSYADAVFTAAREDGFDSASTVRDLSVTSNLSSKTAQVRSGSGGTTGKVYYATYSGTGTPACGSSFNWTKWTLVTNASGWTAAQKTNYANWYSFYRTRMLAMRSAIGRVMGTIDPSRFRIGFSSISTTSYAKSDEFLPVDDFDVGTQKSDFLTRLYTSTPSGLTPLRPALERIGKYYAAKQLDGSALPSGTPDPIQYSCQRNYAVLTTDGYWNTSAESNLRASYAPTRLNGTTSIGNQDGGTTKRPMLDDGRTSGSNWVTGGSGVENTLADIAAYFYQTDLRPGTAGSSGCIGAIAGQDVCTDNVKSVGTKDTAKHQHMTTFTIGLGVAGQLTYPPPGVNYESASSGDFFDITNGTRAWPNPEPTNTANTVTARADDLWHAAVNGRGYYHSASNPSDLVAGMAATMAALELVTGSASAAATSSLRPVTGDNYVFVGQYSTVEWSGNVKMMTIDQEGNLSPPVWQANKELRAQTGPIADTRKILFRRPNNGNLDNFTFSRLQTAGYNAHFENQCGTAPYKLSQCAAMDATKRGLVNSGDWMVRYLRGQRGKENIAAVAPADQLFRARPTTPLGDIINAAPAYLKRPPFRYTDPGYADFAVAQKDRKGVLYVAANDGMLHALDALAGTELWAYVPTEVMKNMWRLADTNYADNHRYFVDGAPVIGEVYDGSKWRSILVGGLNAGGRGYYALDITDPDNPESLWEIDSSTLPNLGLTFGNPVITKAKDGTWVVAFSSGYNNVLPGDGAGYVFVRNAITGAAVSTIATGTGTLLAPSNLGKINAWIESETNNTADRIYAGDMLGNIFRIDHDDKYGAAGRESVLLARALGPTNLSQPITTKPILAKVVSGGTTYPTVSVATGRLLNTVDLTDTTVQSLYVFKDDLSSTGLGVLRNEPSMVRQTITETETASKEKVRTSSATAVDWSTNKGWYVDLLAGERVNVDMVQTDRYLGMASNIPGGSVCNPSGVSWLYTFDMNRGVSTDAIFDDTMAAGLNLVKLGDNVRLIRWDVQGNADISKSLPAGGYTPTPKRSSWRELIN